MAGGKGLVSRPGVLSEEVLLEVAASISPALPQLLELSGKCQCSLPSSSPGTFTPGVRGFHWEQKAPLWSKRLCFCGGSYYSVFVSHLFFSKYTCQMFFLAFLTRDL